MTANGGAISFHLERSAWRSEEVKRPPPLTPLHCLFLHLGGLMLWRFLRMEIRLPLQVVDVYLLVETSPAGVRVVSAGSTNSILLPSPDNLPFLSLLWMNPALIVAAGFSGKQVLYHKKPDDSWFLIIFSSLSILGP